VIFFLKAGAPSGQAESGTPARACRWGLSVSQLPPETNHYAQALGFFHQAGARLFRLDRSGAIEVEKWVKFGT